MMRKSTFASLASVVFALSMALTGCQVGESDDGGNPPSGNPDAGGGNNNPDAGGGGAPDAGGNAACLPNVNTFKTEVYDVVLGPKCVGCHEGFAKFTLSSSDQTANLNTAKAAATKLLDGRAALLAKPSGQGETGPISHSGNISGPAAAEGSTEYQALEKFVGQADGTGCP
jgi:hypothetical protein